MMNPDTAIDSYSLTDNEKKRIGKSLKQLREERGVSQEQLSKMLNCSKQYISDVERGRFGLSLKKVLLISEAYDVPCDVLLYGDPERYKRDDDRTRVMRLVDGLNSDQIAAVVELIKASIKVSDHINK